MLAPPALAGFRVVLHPTLCVVSTTAAGAGLGVVLCPAGALSSAFAREPIKPAARLHRIASNFGSVGWFIFPLPLDCAVSAPEPTRPIGRTAGTKRLRRQHVLRVPRIIPRACDGRYRAQRPNPARSAHRDSAL